MDDFINKLGWGLNLLFANGVGYPSTRFQVFRGSKDEQKFKDYNRRHEAITQVWYNAHAGMTTYDVQRHHRVRKGLEADSLTDAEARAWCRLL